MTIRRLPPEVANRIAAGEVVERPASLVKELVENSLDAAATRIEVTFEGGGIDMIRVSDDGSGIAPQEVKLAFERHATSKVWDPADLTSIETLGFRGEALASIAAVSRVELLTSTGEGPATRIRLEAGAVVEQTQGARARGTTIEVMALFYNTPARRKFLRTPATEGRVLTRTIGQLALGAPGVGFRIVRDGRTVLDVAPADDFRERTKALFGAETVSRMVALRGARDGVEVSGLISPADFSRMRSNHQVLLVNGRPILDASLAHAATAGIGGAVPSGKYPIFAMEVRVDPATVDVNVHPTKREVRFREKNAVYAAIREAVGAAVIDTSFDRFGRTGTLPWRETRPAPPPAAPVRAPGQEIPRSSPGVPARTRSAESPPAREPARSGAAAEPSPVSSRAPLAVRQLRLVGELWGAYLVVEDEDRLLVIDQHAAHERVLYDEIRESHTSVEKLPVQGLLVPLNVELAPGQDPDEVATILDEIGFDARSGGPSSVLVDGIPGTLSRWGGGEFLRELFSSPEGAVKSAEKLRDAIAKSYSCKGAVKFGQRLHAQEIEHLLRALEKTDVPRLCPHGRPIYLEVTKDAIDDRFERS